MQLWRNCRNLRGPFKNVLCPNQNTSCSFTGHQNDLHHRDCLHHSNITLPHNVANEYIWGQRRPGQEILRANPDRYQCIPSYHLQYTTSRVRTGIQSLDKVFAKSEKRFCTKKISKTVFRVSELTSPFGSIVGFSKDWERHFFVGQRTCAENFSCVISMPQIAGNCQMVKTYRHIGLVAQWFSRRVSSAIVTSLKLNGCHNDWRALLDELQMIGKNLQTRPRSEIQRQNTVYMYG